MEVLHVQDGCVHASLIEKGVLRCSHVRERSSAYMLSVISLRKKPGGQARLR